MAVYMVERDLRDISLDELSGAQATAIETAAELTADGTPISYIRSTFVPEDGRCMCLFEAGSEQVVKTLNDKAAIPYGKITKALDLTP